MMVFFGNERLATAVSTTCPTLKKLVKNSYKVSAVICKPTAKNRSRKIKPQEILPISNDLGLRVFQPKKLNEIKEDIAKLNPEIGVLVAYGNIIPKDIIDLFPKGIINIHPSLLPRHRGPTPIESVILNGEKRTGVSLMGLTDKMDAGPIYAQKEIDVPLNVSKQELSDTLLELGSDLLIENLPTILTGKIEPMKQDESRSTYDKLISKSDGTVSWSESADKIERQVRAYLGWPGSLAELNSRKFLLKKCHVINQRVKAGRWHLDSQDRLIVGCSNKSLQLIEVHPPGKSTMSGIEFVRGYLT